MAQDNLDKVDLRCLKKLLDASIKDGQEKVERIHDLQNEITAIRAAFAPVADWYGEEPGREPVPLPVMVAEAVADLQSDRAEVLRRPTCDDCQDRVSAENNRMREALGDIRKIVEDANVILEKTEEAPIGGGAAMISYVNVKPEMLRILDDVGGGEED